MYGIVNKAIEDLVKSTFGPAVWDTVKQRSGINIDFFVSSEPYDDDVTYKLATTVSEETSLTLYQVLHAFGEWWILKTGKEKYGGLMQAGGNNLKEFLVNLPMFHNRIMLMYPKLTPPEFKVSDITDNSVHVHYFSHRQGLQPFVSGLLSGLALMYATEADIIPVASRENGDDHDIFKVSW